jgi:hypothetical protein
MVAGELVAAVRTNLAVVVYLARVGLRGLGRIGVSTGL